MTMQNFESEGEIGGRRLLHVGTKNKNLFRIQTRMLQ